MYLKKNGTVVLLYGKTCFFFWRISICLSDLTTKGLVPLRHHATGFRFLDEVMSRIADGKISHGTLFGDILIATFKSIFNVNIQCRRFLN